MSELADRLERELDHYPPMPPNSMRLLSAAIGGLRVTEDIVTELEMTNAVLRDLVERFVSVLNMQVGSNGDGLRERVESIDAVLAAAEEALK